MKNRKLKSKKVRGAIEELVAVGLDELTTKPNKFLRDVRAENPDLHMLYVKWACAHLTKIDRCIRFIDDCSNLNMLGMTIAMQEQRTKLVTENAAYAEAQEILDMISQASLAELAIDPLS